MPLLTSGTTPTGTVVITGVSPAITLVSALGPPAPLMGTCCIWMPVRDFSSSLARWVELPMPADAKLSRCGSALAILMRSGNVFTPRLGATTVTNGVLAMTATPVKSRAGWCPSDLYRCGFHDMFETPARNSV
ncbi:hypothetical protein D3C87_1585440 [compost metagenome]